eukprot:CAMPEP_0183729536 /NCGR_PEP_ID=MMETSP0737-20130205/30569_1 /TAXON_ID=385413 /ORGANISM="Thalassiosira miniscula, Strain CCMP1093" /LENGTH=211 /DNA_ID=CAMNT_0025961751 /DNA_START=57 /DNA_END=689 /DNA_ORIENTATION=+
MLPPNTLRVMQVSALIVIVALSALSSVVTHAFRLADPTNPSRKLHRRPIPEPLQNEVYQGNNCTKTIAGGKIIGELTQTLRLTPLERIALTCSGNLINVMSSYHLRPVTLSLEKFELANDNDDDGGVVDDDEDFFRPPLAIYDRVVTIKILDEVFCRASSKVRIYDAEMATQVLEGTSIAQLMRAKDEDDWHPPVFLLHDAGRGEDGVSLW